ncbi:MAG: sel1 repeat family protein [Alphaproteobacteria bacterium]|nr:sel1 repeat family protein [Alphaproteobacteria bacterium]MBN2779485.1 sel1 repeat family protein [Alphaproteobacteria bacterium]
MPKKKPALNVPLKERFARLFERKSCECHPVLQEHQECHVCCTRGRHHRVMGLALITVGIVLGLSWMHPYTQDKIQSFSENDVCDLGRLQKRAEGGDVASQMELVKRYTTDCYALPFSIKHKNYWLHKAAQEEGSAAAQYQLAVLYAIGETLPRNYQESMKWLKMAAEQEYMPAEYELAKRYKKGSLFVKPNPQEFLFWLMRAAHSGSDRASEELGYLYEKGIFVPENKIEAYKWYSLATHKDSNKLDMLELGLTKDQIEQAQREASVLYKRVFEKINK